LDAVLELKILYSTGGDIMRRGVNIFLALTILSVLFFGCAGTLKDTKIKCPKCGAFFSTKEGADEFERMKANPPSHN
jgi:hypothetical protein